MRQVPKYLVIGNGRAAKHFCHYFHLLQIPFLHWHRRSNVSLQAYVSNVSHILLLIADDAIDPFIQDNPFLSEKILVHFSGCHISKFTHSAHPIITLSNSLYELDIYKNIPFVIEKEGPAFQELLPGLNNSHFSISRHEKPYYHSLCVMANNFTTILWQKFFRELETRFKIPHEQTLSLLESTLFNIKNHYQTALTGPLVRQDQKVIEKNLDALQNDPFYIVYQAFIKAFGESQ